MAPEGDAVQDFETSLCNPSEEGAVGGEQSETTWEGGRLGWKVWNSCFFSDIGWFLRMETWKSGTLAKEAFNNGNIGMAGLQTTFYSI